MQMMICRALVSLALILIAAGSYAGQRVLDLSTAPGSKVSLTAPSGEVVTFRVINKLPNAKYTVTVEERIIEIDPLPVPEQTRRALLGTDPCASILADARTLADAKDEAAVGKTVRKIREVLDTCKPSEARTEIDQWLRQTEEFVQGAYVVHAGAEIVLIVQREEKMWTMTVSGGERGRWLTTYGVAIVPSKDKPYFLKPSGDDKFTVTPEQETDDLHLIPSVFFTWLPRKRMLGDYAIGPTAGLGLSKSKAAVFAGVGLTYNWNLGFIAGLAVSPHTQVNGRYKADDTLTENIADDQLNRDVYKPTWVVAFTFRFAGNPFGGGEGGDDKKAARNRTRTSASISGGVKSGPEVRRGSAATARPAPRTPASASTSASSTARPAVRQAARAARR